MNGHHSAWSDVSSGVPQGSGHFGTSSFTMYANDISSIVQSEINMFADDVTLYQQLRTVNNCRVI